MKLKTSDQEEISDPTEEQIRDTLQRLEEGGFAILAKEDNGFVQCSVDANSNFVLEYREGTDSELLHAKQESLPRDRIEAVFIAYLNGETAWKQDYAWEEVDMSGSGCLSVLLLILTFGLIQP